MQSHPAQADFRDPQPRLCHESVPGRVAVTRRQPLSRSSVGGVLSTPSASNDANALATGAGSFCPARRKPSDRWISIGALPRETVWSTPAVTREIVSHRRTSPRRLNRACGDEAQAPRPSAPAATPRWSNSASARHADRGREDIRHAAGRAAAARARRSMEANARHGGDQLSTRLQHASYLPQHRSSCGICSITEIDTTKSNEPPASGMVSAEDVCTRS